jgi:hypothetical protein
MFNPEQQNNSPFDKRDIQQMLMDLERNRELSAQGLNSPDVEGQNIELFQQLLNQKTEEENG